MKVTRVLSTSLPLAVFAGCGAGSQDAASAPSSAPLLGSSAEVDGLLASAPAAAPDDSPGARCRRLLSRFDPAVAEDEQGRCESALTDGRALRDCEAAGKRAAYEDCFESCIRSVDATDAVDNCEGPCAQIECEAR